jgi:hypothetical protein
MGTSIRNWSRGGASIGLVSLITIGSMLTTSPAAHSAEASDKNLRAVATVSQPANPQGAFLDLVNSLQEQEPLTYAAAEVYDNGTGWLSFKGEPSPQTRAAIAASGVVTEVRTDAPATRQQMDESLPAVSEALTSSGVSDFRLESNPDLTALTVRLDETSVSQSTRQPALPDGALSPEPSDTEEIRAAIEDILPAGISVALVDDTDPQVDKQSVWGGRSIYDSTGQTCTSGYQIIRGNNSGSPKKGTLTAGHCPDDGQRIAGSDSPLVFVKAVPGAYGDAQFMSSTDKSIRPDIWIKSGVYQAVNAVGDAVVGETVCNYGARAEGVDDCAKVLSVNVCAGNVCSLVKTDGKFTKPGDSGGPWYNGSRAMGIHSGVDSAGRAYFSRMTRILTSLEARLIVGSRD